MKNVKIGKIIDKVSLYGIIIHGLNRMSGTVTKSESNAALLLISFLMINVASKPETQTISELKASKNKYFFPKNGIDFINANRETMKTLFGYVVKYALCPAVVYGPVSATLSANELTTLASHPV